MKVFLVGIDRVDSSKGSQ